MTDHTPKSFLSLMEAYYQLRYNPVQKAIITQWLEQKQSPKGAIEPFDKFSQEVFRRVQTKYKTLPDVAELELAWKSVMDSYIPPRPTNLLPDHSDIIPQEEAMQMLEQLRARIAKRRRFTP